MERRTIPIDANTDPTRTVGTFRPAHAVAWSSRQLGSTVVTDLGALGHTTAAIGAASSGVTAFIGDALR